VLDVPFAQFHPLTSTTHVLDIRLSVNTPMQPQAPHPPHHCPERAVCVQTNQSSQLDLSVHPVKLKFFASISIHHPHFQPAPQIFNHHQFPGQPAPHPAQANIGIELFPNVYIAFNHSVVAHQRGVEAHRTHCAQGLPAIHLSRLIAIPAHAGIAGWIVTGGKSGDCHHLQPKLLISISPADIVKVSLTLITTIFHSGFHHEKSSVPQVISRFSYCLINTQLAGIASVTTQAGIATFQSEPSPNNVSTGIEIAI